MGVDSLFESAWDGSINFSQGMSNLTLERICSPRHARSERKFFDSPRLFWSSEIYSHGVGFRDMFRWPRWLPLPFYSDHGVHFSSLLAPHEIQSNARLHLTWSVWRSSPPALSNHKEVLRVVHPWVWLRNKLSIGPKKNRNGTLIFVPHSLPNRRRYSDLVSILQPYVEDPTWPRPLAICLAMHDVNMGVHHELQPLKLPIFSLGNSASPLMFARFYDLVGRFEACVSPEIGTQTFLSQEFGVDYTVTSVGDTKSVTSQSDGGEARSREALFSRVFSTSCENLVDSLSKGEVVRQALSTDLMGEEQLPIGRSRLARELLRLTPEVKKKASVYFVRNIRRKVR